jgi:hypothetical protein
VNLSEITRWIWPASSRKTQAPSASTPARRLAADRRRGSARAAPREPSNAVDRGRPAAALEVVVAAARTRSAPTPAARRASTRCPSARRTDVARSASSGGNAVALTLMPMPTTTCSTVAPAVAISVRCRPACAAGCPPSIRASTSCTSFGHLRRGTTPSAATASATAAPASSVSGGISAGARDGRSSKRDVEVVARRANASFAPRRPRPAVCASAAITSPAGPPARARSAQTSFVDEHAGEPFVPAPEPARRQPRGDEIRQGRSRLRFVDHFVGHRRRHSNRGSLHRRRESRSV